MPMATPAFSHQSQPFRSSMSTTTQPTYSHPIPSHFDRDSAMSGGSRTQYSSSPSSFALLRRLPLDTSEHTVRLMTTFSKELTDIQILPEDQSEDPGFRSALLRFKSPAGAQEAKNMLDGRSHSGSSAPMIVEVGNVGPASNWMYSLDTAVPNAPSTNTSSATSSTTSSRQPSRFNGSFQPLERVSPPMNGIYGSGELANSEPTHYHNLFTSQSPIGTHLERTRMSGKTLINNDGPDDDETGELLKDPVAYAEHAQQRRANVPHPLASRMASLSLHTSGASGPPAMHTFGHPNMPSMPAHSNVVSPTSAIGSGANFNSRYRGNNLPPANPADQNPPCNTLYVGNLPIDTAEEELKALFSKQRGYKRLCFRTKQNGPMCFVEFEDVTFATKALTELYGCPLHNSVKGGIRLSFSKNPLGVRSGQAPSQTPSGNMPGMNGMMSGTANGFAAANGPPPGLGAPPGLNTNRLAFSGNNGVGGSYAAGGFSSPASSPWNMYNGAMGNGPASMMAGGTSNFAPHMMGR